MMSKNFGVLGWIAFILIIIGGLNWGLIGFFNFNLVDAIFGMGAVSRIIYALVGLAALYSIFVCCKCCKGGSSSTSV